MKLCVLASGSSGNCSILDTPGGVVLIDAGIGPRTFAKRAESMGLKLGDIRAVLLTHLDHDHFKRSWLPVLLRTHARLFVAQRKRRELLGGDSPFEPVVRTFKDDKPFELVPDLQVTATACAHDAAGSHAFVIEGFGGAVGYATDLGCVPPGLIDAFTRRLDVLAIESNYDPEMQRRSGRPWFLQQRIMGGSGHLSNEQAFIAVTDLFDRLERMGLSLPRKVVLLHRSDQCNDPAIVRDLFHRDARLHGRVLLSERHSASDWLCCETASTRFAETLFG